MQLVDSVADIAAELAVRSGSVAADGSSVVAVPSPPTVPVQ